MLTNTQKLTYTAMLLAISIISMIFKSGGTLVIVFLTGAIVNACIIIDTALCGLLYGVILSVIAPVAAQFISPGAVQTAVPVVIPCIMAGNALIALCVALIGKKEDAKILLPVSMVAGSIVLGLLILPAMLPEKMMGKLSAFQFTFSFVQLFSALVGSVYAFVVLRFTERQTAEKED